LSFAYGNAPESSFAYNNYGFILCGVVGDIETGYQFGQLALELTNQLGEKQIRVMNMLPYNALVRPWKEHVRKTLPTFLVNYQIGLEVGNLEYVAYYAFYYSYASYSVGEELVNLEQEIEQSYNRSFETRRYPLLAEHIVANCLKFNRTFQ